MFFNLHPEHKIGFKKLSKPDLGSNDTSHQTHIGLYENILDFLPNTGDCVQTAMLIYDTYCDIVDCTFNRILTPQGTYRSPKIKYGNNRESSIVKKIRDFASAKPNLDWYLVWFGLESEELVFWLFNSTSQDYKALSQIFHQVNHVYTITDEKGLINLVEKRINKVSVDLQKDMEIIAQTGGGVRQYKSFDLDKAAEVVRQTGRRGEELVAKWLEKQKFQKHIKDYEWLNKSREAGRPYDFYIDGRLFVDVKATQYDFNQQIVFSSQEMKFISTKQDWQYAVYRVYDVSKTKQKLKVCSNCLQYVEKVKTCLTHFNDEMSVIQAEAHTVKIAVLPKPMFNKIGSEINL